MRELLQEILASIKRNKLRTFLTGFSVAWGIFMLIVLLGSGNGLQNGMLSNFGNRSQNSIMIGGGRTSKTYKGFQKGRRIRFDSEVGNLLRSSFPGTVKELGMDVYAGAQTISYGTQYVTVSLEGPSPEYAKIENYDMLYGRFINESDMRERRKVVVIDQITWKTLFKDADPVGKMIQVGKIGYTVVGVYKTSTNWDSSILFIPLTTMISVYNGGKDEIGEVLLTIEGVDTYAQSVEFEERLRKVLGDHYQFAADDHRAMWAWNRMEQYTQNMMIFGGISMFIWIIGIGTLMAGIVGVSNIMLVTVRERTNEFGIRKAIGARPSQIVRMVLVESIIITAVFGYVGMVFGVGIMEVVNYVMEQMPQESTSDKFVIFKNPTLNLSITIVATLVLIASGMIAGYVPARRAARIKAIDAMRYNK